MDANIWIFSRPIRSGKTTALMRWAQNRKDVGGFLVPDDQHLRKLLTLKDRKWYDFEVPAESVSQLKPKDLVCISRFNFYRSTFDLAQKILFKDMERGLAWIVVDEVGKLEMKGMGLEPALGQVIDLFTKRPKTENLLLVVRHELLDSVIERHKLENYQVVENLNSLG
jgi:nucleoside-triphosphatase THEP1